MTANVHRHVQGLLIGLGFMAVIAAGLAAFGAVRWGVRGAALMSLMTLLPMGLGIWTVVRSHPRWASLDGQGLHLHFASGRTDTIPLDQFEYVRMTLAGIGNRAPEGGRTRILTFKPRGRPQIQFSDAEFTQISDLLDAIVEHLPDVIEDKRDA